MTQQDHTSVNIYLLYWAVWMKSGWGGDTGFFSFVAFHQLIANSNQFQVFGCFLIQLRLKGGNFWLGDSDFGIFALDLLVFLLLDRVQLIGGSFCFIGKISNSKFDMTYLRSSFFELSFNTRYRSCSLIMRCSCCWHICFKRVSFARISSIALRNRQYRAWRSL